jgi:hypothetical protein
MSDTKTYPLSAIMGEETNEYERGYAQGFADAYNRLCAENADFVAESIKADSRIAELESEVKTLRDKHDDCMAIVPVEPTYHMLVQGCEKCFGRADKTLYAKMKDAYKTMLSASK